MYRVRLGKTDIDKGLMIVPKEIICHPESVQSGGEAPTK